jgi:hypothetical protein
MANIMVDDILAGTPAVQCKTKVRLERAFATTTRSPDLDLASGGLPPAAVPASFLFLHFRGRRIPRDSG